MQVTREQIDPCKIALTISVEPEKVEAAKEKAFGQFARNLQIPGFRKGKVPAPIARSYVDATRVKQRAAELLVEPSYQEALKETQLEPFASPELELVEMNDEGPLVFKAVVPLRPVVTIGPYKGLNIERRRIEVTEADVDRQIEELRNRLAEYEGVEGRTAQTGDILFADLTATVEGQDTTELQTPRSTAIEVGKNIPDFDNGLVGMAGGETKTIEAIYPDEFADESMRGKRATFTITLNEIRTRNLPALDDTFAQTQKAYPDTPTLEALRGEVRAGLEKAAQEIADNDLEARLVGQIVDTSQINFPDVILRAEMEQDAEQLKERLEQQNASIEQFLETTGKTADEVEQEMAAAADRRIRNSLVLSEIAQHENIAVEEADVEAELAKRAERARVSVAAVRAFVEKNNQMDGIRNRALTDKTLAFLKVASNVTEKVVQDAEIGGPGETPVTPTEPAEPLALEQAGAPRRKTASKAAAESQGDVTG